MQTKDELTKRILSAKTIAIVGLSKDGSKPSHIVAKYLLAHGKKIIPVIANHESNSTHGRFQHDVVCYAVDRMISSVRCNPAADEILGQKCYKSLLDIPAKVAKEIEIVDVFRKSRDVPPIAKDAIELRRRNANGKPEIFWMQIGIINEAAASEAEKAGLKIVMDRCVKIEHEKYAE